MNKVSNLLTARYLFTEILREMPTSRFRFRFKYPATTVMEGVYILLQAFTLLRIWKQPKISQPFFS